MCFGCHVDFTKWKRWGEREKRVKAKKVFSFFSPALLTHHFCLMKHDVSVHWNTPAIQARKEQLYFGETFPCSSHCITNHHPNNLGHMSLKKRPILHLFDLKDTILKKKVAIFWHQYLQSFWPGYPAYCLFSSMWRGNHFYSPNKKNIEFLMHSKSFVKGKKWQLWHQGKIKN